MADLCVSILFVWVRKCVFICRLPVSVAHVLLFFGNILISDEWVRHSQRFYSCVVRPRSKSELSAVLLCVFRSFCLCPQDCPRLCNCASLLNSQVLHCLTFSWGSCSSSVRWGKWAIFRLQHISQKDRTPGTINKEINEMKLKWYQITKNSSSIIHWGCVTVDMLLCSDSVQCSDMLDFCPNITSSSLKRRYSDTQSTKLTFKSLQQQLWIAVLNQSNPIVNLKVELFLSARMRNVTFTWHLRC